MILKKYQKKAVKDLYSKSLSLFENRDTNKKIIVFKAPTGAGKTVMMAKYIEQMNSGFIDEDFCFIWLSNGEGEIHIQSKKKLEKILQGHPSCKLVEDALSSNAEIQFGEVVVANWESLNNKDKKTKEWTNVLMRDGETKNFIQLINQTNAKRKIILIIDESHKNTDTNTSQEIIDLINPEIIIEVSATPKRKIEAEQIENNEGYQVTVKSKDVIEEGIIKKEIKINDDVLDIDLNDSYDEELLILEKGFEKLNEIKEEYNKLNININPLCLIQIPNSDEGKELYDKIYSYLDSKGYNFENEKVSLHLSDKKDKINIEDIAENTHKSNFLIFKQAVATGWDCPRAQILIKYRESKSTIFEIQVVGRILRMPEQKHYDNEVLDNAYIYTNTLSDNIKINSNGEYKWVKQSNIKLKDIAKDLELPSEYIKRKEMPIITQKIKNIMEELFLETLNVSPNYDLETNIYNLKECSFELENVDIVGTISEGHINTLDLDFSKNIEVDNKTSIRYSNSYINKLYVNVLQEDAKKFVLVVPRILKNIMFNLLNKDKGTDNEYIEKVILFNYEKHIKYIVQETKTRYEQNYKEETSLSDRKEKKVVSFKIPTYDIISSEDNLEKVDFKKYAYEECYLNKKRSNPEKQFEIIIDNDKNVLWWWKNKDNGSNGLGIVYYNNKDEEHHTFYPDYIVQFIDGTYGIYETKSYPDRDADVTYKKIIMLNRFMQRCNLKGGVACLDSKTNKFYLSSKDYFDIRNLEEVKEKWIKINNSLI